MDSYYVRWKGQVTGPVSVDDLRGMIKNGRVSKHHQISVNRLEWTPLIESEDFRDDCVTKVQKLKLKGAGGMGGELGGYAQSGGLDAPIPTGIPVGQGGAAQQGNASDSCEQDNWYYTTAAGVEGPVSRAKILSMAASGVIKSETPVCAEGTELWRHAGEVFSGLPNHMTYLPGPLHPTGPVNASGVAPIQVPNHLAQAILVTLLCCLPFGIVAIVYASQVNGRLQAGDIRGAIDASGKASTWVWVSFGAGLLVSIGYGVFCALAAS